MVEVNVESHNMGPTFYRLTSLSFKVNQPFHSWDTAFSKFDLENPRSRSWVRRTLKVTTWVHHYIDSQSFRLKSISHSIAEIQHFQNLTLKIQGQGHGWGECWKSQHGSIIISTHIPFVPCQSAIQFLRYNFFKIWPWKSNVKVMVKVKVEIYKVGVTSYRLTSFSFHVNWPSHSRDTAFSKFYLENPRSRSWVRWKSHNLGPTFYRLASLSFHVNRPSHSWNMTFSIFYLENPRSRSWLRSKPKVTKWV